VTSGEGGAFSFTAVVPGSYTVKAAHSGFKTFERTGLMVSANEHVALGEIALQLGATSETVTVISKAARVETDSSELSQEITAGQLGNLTARGRDMVSRAEERWHVRNARWGDSACQSCPNQPLAREEAQ
jgi:hypothetical protein